MSEGDAIDTTSLFYTSDTVVLNRLKKELHLYNRAAKNGVGVIYQCGYPFWFCVFKEGKLLLKLPANLEWGYMSTSMGQLLFKSSTLQQYKKEFKPLIIRYTCFDNVEERARYVELLQKDPYFISYKVLGNQPNSSAFLLETIHLR